MRGVKQPALGAKETALAAREAGDSFGWLF